jgi:hypothetical protein
MFRDFARERRGAPKKVVGHLKSAAYRESMEWLERFFSKPVDLPTPTFPAPMGPVVAKRIYEAKRIVKIERSLGGHAR